MDTEDNTITSLSSFQGAWEKKNRMELSLNCKLIQTHKLGFLFFLFFSIPIVNK